MLKQKNAPRRSWSAEKVTCPVMLKIVKRAYEISATDADKHGDIIYDNMTDTVQVHNSPAYRDLPPAERARYMWLGTKLHYRDLNDGQDVPPDIESAVTDETLAVRRAKQCLKESRDLYR